MSPRLKVPEQAYREPPPPVAVSRPTATRSPFDLGVHFTRAPTSGNDVYVQCCEMTEWSLIALKTVFVDVSRLIAEVTGRRMLGDEMSGPKRNPPSAHLRLGSGDC